MDIGFVLLRPLLLAIAGGVLILLLQLLPETDRRRSWLPAFTYTLLAVLFLGLQLSDLLLFALALWACGFFAYRYYARPTLPLPAHRRWSCAVCRALALMLLLLVLGRPAWNSEVEERHRPVLVALLDQSESIGLRDPVDGDGPTRAEQANATFLQEAARLEQLESLYEVRRLPLSGDSEPLNAWNLAPRAPQTELAAALQRGALQRSSLGRTPAGMLLLSDGAETVSSSQAVIDAGQALAQRAIPLYAVGVGPGASETPGVLLEPLTVPGEVGLRDAFDVAVAAQVFGCDGQRVALEVAWDDPVEQRLVRVAGNEARLRESVRVSPPRPGLQRLRVRVSLPPERGGDTFETSTVVNVRDETIRVLLLARQPNSELAFLSRALRGDARYEVRTVLRPDAAPRSEPLPDFRSFDVVLLGRMRLQRDESTALANAVREAGTGLMLHGGRRLLNDPEVPLGAIADVSPTNLALRRTDTREVQFRPTRRATRHEVLAGLLDDENYQQLPALAGGAILGAARSLAEQLLVDQDGAALLVVHTIDAGRAAVATWEATWPWALASDAGTQWHRQFWRQMINWLAHRRPEAWVLSDQVRYSSRALAGGADEIEIEAGVTGTRNAQLRNASWSGTLTLEGEGREPQQIPLQRVADKWIARLPAASPGLQFEPGTYRLIFEATAEPKDGEAITIDATAGFVVEEVDAERRSPTANLALLRAAAEETSEVGGRYVGLTSLATLLDELTAEDPSERVMRRQQLLPTDRYPWSLWVPIVGLLGLEWVLRKRAGLP